MDYTRKYYLISEVLNDNLRDVAIALRIAGEPQKPAIIYNELVEGRVDKFHEAIDFLMDTIAHDKAKMLLFAYIRDFKRLSHKYNFSVPHETRVGAINNNYTNYKAIKEQKQEVSCTHIQIRFTFEEQ